MKSLVLMVLFLLPFAVYENVAGSPILIELFGKIFSVYDIVGSEERFGLRRAQGTFEYSILFGVVCSSAFALSFYDLAPPRYWGAIMFGTCGNGSRHLPVLRSYLVACRPGNVDRLGQGHGERGARWAILATVVIVAYIAVDFSSNRNPFDVFISYLTFNSDTSYMRVHIWNYGTQSVMSHPIFGIGLNDGNVRRGWAAASIISGWSPPFATASPAFCS